jgi:hypothetical protein
MAFESILAPANLLAVALVALAALSGHPSGAAEPAGSRSSAESSAKADRVFEMRIYTAHPGKLEALHKRFREHTNFLFVKHGMEPVGYWTPTDGEQAANTLVYILAYPSRESAEKSWKAFRDDPEWKAAYAESHKDGPIVMKVESKFLAPVDYSPIR